MDKLLPILTEPYFGTFKNRIRLRARYDFRRQFVCMLCRSLVEQSEKIEEAIASLCWYLLVLASRDSQGKFQFLLEVIGLSVALKRIKIVLFQRNWVAVLKRKLNSYIMRSIRLASEWYMIERSIRPSARWSPNRDFIKLPIGTSCCQTTLSRSDQLV